MKYFIFISVLALGQCRPQVSHQGPAVERQPTIIELPKTAERIRPLTIEEEAKLNATTQNILQKIAEVNLSQGLKPKIMQRPTYFSAYVPTHNHPKSIDNKEITNMKSIENIEIPNLELIDSKDTLKPVESNKEIQSQPKLESKGKQLPNFEFPATPFTNPIFDYLKKEKENAFLTKSTLASGEEEIDEKIPEGYAIKRKIIHKQTILVPNYEQFMNPNYNQMDASQIGEMMSQMAQVPQMGQVSQVGQHNPQIAQLASQFEQYNYQMGQPTQSTNQQINQFAPQITAQYPTRMNPYAPQLGQYASQYNPYVSQMGPYATSMSQYPQQINQYNHQIGQFTPPRQGHYGLIPLSENFQNYPTMNQAFGNTKKKNQSELDDMTKAKQNFLINNIKNIVSNSHPGSGFYSNIFNPYASQHQLQMQPQPYSPELGPYQHQPYSYNPYNFQSNPSINPYSQFPFHPGQYSSAGPYQNIPQYSTNSNINFRRNPYPSSTPLAYNAQLPPNFQTQEFNDKFGDTYYANLQTEKETGTVSSNRRKIGRQFNVPFAEYFPIVIKNPFQQMFQAFTSMVEYGPEADICSRGIQKDEVNRAESKSRSNKMEYVTTKPSFELKDNDTNTEIIIQTLEETTEPSKDDYYIEGLQITSGQTENEKKEIMVDPKSREMGDEFLEEDKFFQPMRNQQVKETSKNGIFIDRLKVRKGGVAIAGPGGIATAGSGGTAIVGPNGFAYTQPNGVAIAGPGSRVISVDPKVNLSEYVYNLTRADGSTPRIGKVVAVGPVIYHDLGKD